MDSSKFNKLYSSIIAEHTLFANSVLATAQKDMKDAKSEFINQMDITEDYNALKKKYDEGAEALAKLKPLFEACAKTYAEYMESLKKEIEAIDGPEHDVKFDRWNDSFIEGPEFSFRFTYDDVEYTVSEIKSMANQADVTVEWNCGFEYWETPNKCFYRLISKAMDDVANAWNNLAFRQERYVNAVQNYLQKVQKLCKISKMSDEETKAKLEEEEVNALDEFTYCTLPQKEYSTSFDEDGKIIVVPVEGTKVEFGGNNWVYAKA